MSKPIVNSRAARRAGMTLIEVMLTIIILGIAGIVLITTTSQGLGVVRAARLYNHAHMLLARVDLEHPLFDDDVEVGSEQGRFPRTELGDFTWSRTIEAIGEEEDGLFEVRTRVSWTRRGQTGFEEVVYFRFAPKDDS